MIEIVMILSIIPLLLVAKMRIKKPVFGQLTLRGNLALDWMKDGMEIVIGKVMIGPLSAFPEYNIPTWADERSGDVGVIDVAGAYANPIMVTQRSILRALEHWCVEREALGDETRVEKKGSSSRGVLIIKENHPTLRFTRGKNPTEFKEYEVIDISKKN